MSDVSAPGRKGEASLTIDETFWPQRKGQLVSCFPNLTRKGRDETAGRSVLNRVNKEGRS
jgi:hypothetical protein